MIRKLLVASVAIAALSVAACAKNEEKAEEPAATDTTVVTPAPAPDTTVVTPPADPAAGGATATVTTPEGGASMTTTTPPAK